MVLLNAAFIDNVFYDTVASVIPEFDTAKSGRRSDSECKLCLGVTSTSSLTNEKVEQAAANSKPSQNAILRTASRSNF